MLRDLRPSNFQAECTELDNMLVEMKRLFEPGSANGLDLATRVAAAEALGQTGHPLLALPGDDSYWRTLEAAVFLMGDEPTRTEMKKAFRIGRYPVPVWEYGKFVDSGGAVPDGWYEQAPHPSCPVVGVSWYDEEAYCKWAGCRLPTEEEWELAARGTDGRRFPWGLSDPTELLANVQPWGNTPTPVGMFPDGRSPYGCDDMTGNVWEWTSSTDDSDVTVARGGAWNSPPEEARCAYRHFWHPSTRISYLGFRCAMRQD